MLLQIRNNLFTVVYITKNVSLESKYQSFLAIRLLVLFSQNTFFIQMVTLKNQKLKLQKNAVQVLHT